jgi:polyisoprenyl-teichoic acid--peptidoglycan teichoic acid transferase
MQQGRGVDKGVVLLIVMVAVIAATAVFVITAVRTDEISDLVTAGEQLSAIVVIELDDGRLITEVFFYDFATDRGALFEVLPRTGVVVRSLNRVDSIDTVFAVDGIDVYSEAVSSLVGVEIPFYLHLTESDLEAVVDLAGGVPVFVTDLPNEGPDAVRIPSGDVILDGAKALEYLRYEGEGERDRERIARHQKLVISLLEELGANHDSLSGGYASRVLMSHVRTNIDRAAFVSLVGELSALENDRMITRQIEGIDRRVVSEGSDRVLLFPHQEGRWLKESVRQVVGNLASEESIRDENIVIRVEILNGTDVSGLASRTAQLYRSYGFDVVAVGNAQNTDIESTRVVDRVGSDIFARRAADIIRAQLVENGPDPQSAVDVTIILGKDFDGRYVR